MQMVQHLNLEKRDRASFEGSTDSKKLDQHLGPNVEERASLQLIACMNTGHDYNGEVVGRIIRLGQQGCNRQGGRNAKG